MKKTILIAITAFTLVACTDPKDKIIPSDMGTWESTLKPSIEKLSEEEKKLFLGFTMRAKMGEAFGGKGIESGTTVGKAIELQKKWLSDREAKELEEKALKAKLESEQAALKKQIDDLITVTVIELRLVKEEYREKQVIKLGLQNKGSKDIRGISGTLKFIDMFDKEVGSINFGYTDGLKAGSMSSWTGTRDFNQFMAQHKAIARLEEGKYRTIFEPEMCSGQVFSDTSIGFFKLCSFS